MSSIHIVDNAHFADVVTSSGYFTPSTVLSMVILSHIYDDLKIYRTQNLSNFTNDTGKNLLIIDLYDDSKYARKKDYGHRENSGIKYSLCGLIWKDFGMSYCKSSPFPIKLFSYMDSRLFQGVDLSVTTGYPDFLREIGLSTILETYNPGWNSKKDFNTAFLEACNLGLSIFDNLFETGLSILLAKKQIEEALNNATSNYLILNPGLPWKEILLSSKNPKASNIEFIIFQMEDNKCLWRTVPKDINNNIPRRSVPKTWLPPISSDGFSKLTGIQNVLYCHHSGTCGETTTLSAAIKLINLATSLSLIG